ncbi:MAG: type IV toxin-antitoxin system AbiEi family antitoxin domain-containing protein [Myxococcaceae bacterium]
MNALTIIRKSLKNRIFSALELEDIGITRYALKKLESDGIIEKVSHGVYMLRKMEFSRDEEYKAALFRVGEPSVVCLLSALEYYDLTDIVPKEVWLMVPAHKRTRQKDIRILRTADLKLAVGILKKKDFLITSIERSIVDSLTHQRQLSVTIGIEALRRALQLKKTTLSEIADTAKALKVSDRIRPYIEALA